MITNRHNNFNNGYVLLIGIRYGHWSNKMKPLEGTLKDIEALNNHFKDPAKAGFVPDNIFMLKEENATSTNILRYLDDFSQKVNQDNEASAIIYYSGHGETDGKQSFLLPYNFDIERWQNEKTFDKENVVLSSDFAAKIASIKARKTIIILDCCHSENIPVGKNLQSSSYFLQDTLSELNKALDSNNLKDGNLLPKIKTGSGKIILTSCEAHELSLDLGYNGLFTSVLLECLNGKDNIKKDGWVRLVDIINYVPSKVKELAANNYHHQQNPIFKRIEDLKADDFIICAYDSEQARGTKPVIPLDTSSELTSKQKNIEHYFKLIDDEIASAFLVLDDLDWGYSRGTYNDLKNEFIMRPIGYDASNLRSRIKILLKSIFK